MVGIIIGGGSCAQPTSATALVAAQASRAGHPDLRFFRREEAISDWRAGGLFGMPRTVAKRAARTGR
jgi:hypothetical protein